MNIELVNKISDLIISRLSKQNLGTLNKPTALMNHINYIAFKGDNIENFNMDYPEEFEAIKTKVRDALAFLEHKQMKESKKITLKEFNNTKASIPTPKNILNFTEDDVVKGIKQVFEDHKDYQILRISAQGGTYYDVVVKYFIPDEEQDFNFELDKYKYIVQMHKFRVDLFTELSKLMPVVNVNLAAFDFVKNTDEIKIAFVVLLSQTNNKDWVTGKVTKPDSEARKKLLQTEAVKKKTSRQLKESIEVGQTYKLTHKNDGSVYTFTIKKLTGQIAMVIGTGGNFKTFEIAKLEGAIAGKAQNLTCELVNNNIEEGFSLGFEFQPAPPEQNPGASTKEFLGESPADEDWCFPDDILEEDWDFYVNLFENEEGHSIPSNWGAEQVADWANRTFKLVDGKIEKKAPDNWHEEEMQWDSEAGNQGLDEVDNVDIGFPASEKDPKGPGFLGESSNDIEQVADKVWDLLKGRDIFKPGEIDKIFYPGATKIFNDTYSSYLGRIKGGGDDFDMRDYTGAAKEEACYAVAKNKKSNLTEFDDPNGATEEDEPAQGPGFLGEGVNLRSLHLGDTFINNAGIKYVFERSNMKPAKFGGMLGQAYFKKITPDGKQNTVVMDVDTLNSVTANWKKVEVDETWIDPAGGSHSGDDDEPWKMYESIDKKISAILTEEKIAKFTVSNAFEALDKIRSVKGITKAKAISETLIKIAWDENKLSVKDIKKVLKEHTQPKSIGLRVLPSGRNIYSEVEDFLKRHYSAVNYGEHELFIPLILTYEEMIIEAKKINEQLKELNSVKKEKQRGLGFNKIDFICQFANNGIGISVDNP